MNVFFIAFIILIFSVSITIFVLVAARGKKSGEAVQLERLAGELGLPLLGGEPFLPNVPILKFIKKPFLLEGQHRGR